MIVPDAHIDLNSTQWSENPRDAVVLLAISNKHDRSLLRDYLPATFDIRTSDDQSFIDVEFDICLIDEQHLLENREEVQQLKEDRSPEFIPFLLLSQSSGNRIHEAGLSHLVDDLISIPVPSEVLRSRMDLLLKTRAYSLKLVRQNRQLEENNRKLRIFEKAIQSVNTGVIITDAQQQDNPIVYHNRAFEELTGYPQNEIEGRNCRFLQRDDRDQKGVDAIRRFIEEEREGKARIRNYRKDGTRFWNDLTIAPIKDDDCNTTHFIGLQHDVTELIQTQKRLHKERERYRLLAENSTDMISRHAPDGTYRYVSPHCEQLTGYTPEELTGNDAYEFIHPEDRSKVAASYRKLRSTSKINTVTYRIKTRDSGYLWVETTSRTVWDPASRELVEIQASTRDISERMEHQQSLKKERNLFRKLAQTSPIGITIINPDGRITYANEQSERILGLTKSEITDRTYNDPAWEITDLQGNPFPEEALPFMQVMRKKAAVYDVEHAIVWPDGRRKLLSINAAPLKDADGTIEGSSPPSGTSPRRKPGSSRSGRRRSL